MRSGLILDDRYRLEELIAAGGVGQVWRAVDLLLERPVAVKLLRPEYADHPETLDRFRREAQHAGALSHPGIAQVYDYGHASQDGTLPPYLVMELVDGPSLADLLAVEPADPVLALDVTAQAAAGLAAAHRAGLVHRDVKPGNILLGRDGRVKVTDFGIAYAAGQAPVTGPGLVMGTTQYLAPERIAGAPGGPVSDLYALGIVLHECLTGWPAYEGTAAEVMAGHLYLPLPDLPDGLPPGLDEFVALLTAKDPAERPADALEVAASAARLRDAIRDGTPSHPALATAGRRAGGLATWPGRHSGAPTAAPAADGRQARGRRRAAALAAVATLVAGAGLAGLLGFGVLAGPPTAGSVSGTAASTSATATLGRVPSSSASGPGGAAGPGASASQPSGRKPRHGAKPTPSGSHSPVASTSPTPGASGTPSGTPTTGGTPTSTASPTPTGGGSPSLPIPLPSVTIKL